MTARGIVVAAPASGSGKTTLTLGLLRRLRDEGLRVASAKAGPDFIDPGFHAAATGRPCLNLDPWAMRPETVHALAAGLARDADLLVIEGVMGLFDGTADGSGSTADLAAMLGLPVLLVVDVAAQAQSAAALVRGFAGHRPDVRVAAVALNRVGSPRHAGMVARALAPLGIPVLGAVRRDPALALPDRHLGLVQAREHADLEGFIDMAAARVGDAFDLAALAALAAPLPAGPAAVPTPIAPPGQRVAFAADAAFAFAYPHLLDGWRAAGAVMLPFSPLADEAPDPTADAVFLPGGYPELHAGQLAAAGRFKAGLAAVRDRGGAIYGECGGYMVLGEGLVDADGVRHAMAGLLPLETSFAARKLHLGYRAVRTEAGDGWPAAGAAFRGHEFHYAAVLGEGPGAPLFRAVDAEGADLGGMGLRAGRVAGSFVHLVDRASVQ